MTTCHDLTEISAAISALSASDVAKEKASNFAKRLVSYGVPSVNVAGIRTKSRSELPATPDSGVMLRYEGEHCLAFYMADDDGDVSFSIETRHDNGHDECLEVDPKRYGLIAAMLLART